MLRKTKTARQKRLRNCAALAIYVRHTCDHEGSAQLIKLCNSVPVLVAAKLSPQGVSSSRLVLTNSRNPSEWKSQWGSCQEANVLNNQDIYEGCRF